MQGICTLRVRGEGPMEGPREEEFIFKLVLLSSRQRCAPPLLTLQASLRWAPSDSDSEAARERLRLLALTLSLLGGGG